MRVLVPEPTEIVNLGLLLGSLGSEEGRHETKVFDELDCSVVNRGEHKHGNDHNDGKAEHDQRLIPCPWLRLVDRVESEHVAEDDEEAGGEAKDDLGLHRFEFYRERQNQKGEEAIGQPERGDADFRVVFGNLSRNCACPDGDERGHGEVEELERLAGILEDFEQRVCTFLFVNDLGVL